MNTVFSAIICLASLAVSACSSADFQVQEPTKTDSGPGSDSDNHETAPDGCKPVTRVEACSGKECGSSWDGCSGTYECGGCPSPKVCGGGGTPDRCGCTPMTKEAACSGKNCGKVADGCGGEFDCGSCSAPQVCGGGSSPKPNVCGCTPKPETEVCGAKICGLVSDGCGGKVNCGLCSGIEACGQVIANKCDPCPKNDTQLTAGQKCAVDHSVPRRCKDTSFIISGCQVVTFGVGTTLYGQYCCTE